MHADAGRGPAAANRVRTREYQKGAGPPGGAGVEPAQFTTQSKCPRRPDSPLNEEVHVISAGQSDGFASPATALARQGR